MKVQTIEAEDIIEFTRSDGLPMSIKQKYEQPKKREQKAQIKAAVSSQKTEKAEIALRKPVENNQWQTAYDSATTGVQSLL